MNAPHRPYSPLAIASLASGILGFVLLPFVGSLVAVVTGHLARAGIRRDPGSLRGAGLALAGLVLGYAALALLLAVVAVMTGVIVASGDGGWK